MIDRGLKTSVPADARKGTVPKTKESSGKGREWIGSHGSKKTYTQVFAFSKYCLGSWGDDSAGKMLAVQPSRRTVGWTLRTHVNATQAWQLTCNSSPRRQSQGILGTGQLGGLAVLASSGFD